MQLIMPFEDLEQLVTAGAVRELFGPPEAWQEAELEARLKQYRLVCHPDRFPAAAAQERAQKVTAQLVQLVDNLRQPIVLQAPKRTYQLLRRRWTGDVADIWDGLGDGAPYLVKVSRTPEAAAVLAREQEVVSACWSQLAATHYTHYLPTLVESFPFRRPDRRGGRVNVFAPNRVGLVGLERIQQRYPHGLPGRHLAWILKRLLTVAGAAHQAGWVHGAIVPPHVLLGAEDHGAVLVGWGQAVPLGQPLVRVPAAYRSWYPAPALQRQPVTPAVDIVLLARTVIELAGAASPAAARLLQFCRGCSSHAWRDATGAWQLLEELDTLLLELYGPPRYVQLEL